MQTSDAIHEEIKSLIEDRTIARRALAEIEGLKTATMAMRDAAYEAVASLSRTIDTLMIAFEAALDAEAAASRPATVTITATDFDVLVEAAKAQLRHSKALDAKHGVSWAVRSESDALQAVVARVVAPEFAQAVYA
jgi:hypothetical protein